VCQVVRPISRHWVARSFGGMEFAYLMQSPRWWWAAPTSVDLIPTAVIVVLCALAIVAGRLRAEDLE